MSDARRKAKRPKNLLLDPDAVARGERYSRLTEPTYPGWWEIFSTRSRSARKSWRSRQPSADSGGLQQEADTDKELYRQHLSRKYGSR